MNNSYNASNFINESALDKTIKEYTSLTQNSNYKFLTEYNKTVFLNLISELISFSSDYTIPEHKAVSGKRLTASLKNRINTCKFSKIMQIKPLNKVKESTYISEELSNRFQVYKGGFPLAYTTDKFLKMLLQNITKLKSTGSINLKPKYSIKEFIESEECKNKTFFAIPKKHFIKVIHSEIEAIFNKEGKNSISTVMKSVLAVSSKYVYIDNTPKHRVTEIDGREYTTISTIDKGLRNRLLAKTAKYEYDINSSILTIMLNLRCSIKSMSSNGKYCKEFFNERLKDFKVLSTYITDKSTFITKLSMCLGIKRDEAKTVITALLNDPNFDLFTKKRNSNLNKPANLKFVKQLLKDINALHSDTFKFMIDGFDGKTDMINMNLKVLGISLFSLVQSAKEELGLQRKIKAGAQSPFGKGKRLYPKMVHYMYTTLESKIRGFMCRMLRSNIQIHDCVFSQNLVSTEKLSSAIFDVSGFVVGISMEVAQSTYSVGIYNEYYHRAINSKNNSTFLQRVGKLFDIYKDSLEYAYDYGKKIFKRDIIYKLEQKLQCGGTF